ncbi:hypothetical protein H2198_008999 [Neophaeococcomyces mojaviensis]|uniref:Uncharacterized protein n=1 Tax=Neophaeococcomyces mojaviensis TaxID=3383035 RepID=A0ACC2ZVZ9_9EURO|nr:hypothetical protein H2198_008999 [Knufia sp. JES_112]
MNNIYHPLQPGHIRLLEKLSDHHCDLSTLHFRFQETSLQDHLYLLQPESVGIQDNETIRTALSKAQRSPGLHKYTAISYTWGAPTKSEQICLNGYPFMIGANLAASLDIERRRHDSLLSFIWADAICIHQDDLAERNDQVSMMPLIYGLATSVSAHIGPPITLPSDVDAKNNITILPLIRQDYWTRTWVIQEFLLAQHLTIYSGQSSIDFKLFWAEVHKTLRLYNPYGPNPPPEPYEYSELDRSPALSLAGARQILGDTKFDNRSLYRLLIQHSDARCTDPRDRVFAMLGLVRVEERKVLMRSFPDYSLSIQQVLVMTMAHLVEFDDSGDPAEHIFRALGRLFGKDGGEYRVTDLLPLVKIMVRMRQIGKRSRWLDERVSSSELVKALLPTHAVIDLCNHPGDHIAYDSVAGFVKRTNILKTHRWWGVTARYLISACKSHPQKSKSAHINWTS